jgi:hypothetical protein
MKIGDIIWIRSTEWVGSNYNQKIITGETSRSWLVKSGDPEDAWRLTSTWVKSDKIPKTLKGWELGDEEKKTECGWAVKNRYHISQMVSREYDPAKLREIAKIIGYTEAK